jgi:hypothetical protein
MPPVPPFWFVQRQAKVEPTGTNTFRLTAPNQGEAFIFVERADNGQWSAGLKNAVDGPVVVTSGPIWDSEEDAWASAFELYRNEVVV